ncbi:MAG: hypothetical protein B6245_17010 [Desulfobacteraceae bacterium 4572_88]|nr:MAG: hypothetical protein B6245_17010 [Desulfobacteraceae bacterium 4572_88]
MSELIGNCSVQTHEGLTRFSLPGFPLFHGFFARTGGASDPPYAALNTAYVTKDPKASDNRKLLFQSLEIASSPVRILNPCHGDRIAFVDETDWHEKARNVLIRTDAAFTRKPGTHFLLSTADCIPAILTDDALSFAGVAHLGWRNLLTNFTEKVLTALGSRYKLSPASLRVGIGPMICPCCYVFKDPVQKDDPFWKPFLRDRGEGFWGIDLLSAFRTQLTRCGIPEENILESGLCTGCRNELFFSCYKEGYVSGRFPILVGLK